MAHVLVPLAPGCEELEAVTVVDLLRRAAITVVTAGLDEQPVTASRSMVLVPDMTLDQALTQAYDMIVLPGGGPGAAALLDDARIKDCLQQMAAAGKYTAAICAAPNVLAAAGLLDGRHATSFPGALDVDAIPGLIYEESPVVIDGTLITSRGPGTAIDFTLTLIELLTDRQRRDDVEAGLQRP